MCITKAISRGVKLILIIEQYIYLLILVLRRSHLCTHIKTDPIDQNYALIGTPGMINLSPFLLTFSSFSDSRSAFWNCASSSVFWTSLIAARQPYLVPGSSRREPRFCSSSSISRSSFHIEQYRERKKELNI